MHPRKDGFMGFIKLEKETLKQVFPTEFDTLQSRRRKSRSKFKNDPEEKFVYGFYYCIKFFGNKKLEYSYYLRCQHISSINTSWQAEIVSGPSSFDNEDGIFNHYNLKLPEFDRENKEKENLPIGERMKLPDVRIMAFEHISGMYAGVKKIAVEHPECNAEFVTIDEQSKNLRPELGFARSLFYERLIAAKIGEIFIYRRKYRKINPSPYLNYPVDNSSFVIY